MSASTENITVDGLDRQIIHALQVDPRVPFARLAPILGASEQTVARRYRRLREAGILRVRGLRGPVAAVQDWMVRAEVRAGAATAVAGALAGRDDVSWVGITAGGAEVVCATRPRTAEQRDALLLERLPGASQVTALTAHAILHRYSGSGANEWTAFGDPLGADQAAALVAGRAARPSGVVTNRREGDEDGARIEPGDAELVAALHDDGRASLAQLAVASGWTAGRAARRLEALLASGAVYLDVEVAVELLGFLASALLWISIPPADLDAAAKRIAAAPESAFVAAVTGPANLNATVVCRSAGDLHEFIIREIGSLAGVQALETSPIARRVKMAGSVMDGARLPEPV